MQHTFLHFDFNTTFDTNFNNKTNIKIIKKNSSKNVRFLELVFYYLRYDDGTFVSTLPTQGNLLSWKFMIVQYLTPSGKLT